MTLTRLAVVLMLGTLLVSGAGCGGLAKPTVNYVPDGWHLLVDPEVSGGTHIDYGKWENDDPIASCGISYKPIPSEITAKEQSGLSTEEALIEMAIEDIAWAQDTDYLESGMMTVCNRNAAYAEVSHEWFSTGNYWIYRDMYFIEGNTLLWLSIRCRGAAEEIEAMALLDSITFN